MSFFGPPPLYDTHIFSRYDSRRFVCAIMVWVYGMFFELLLSLTCNAASGGSFQCTFPGCSKSFKNYQTRTAHTLNEHTAAEIRTCHVCGQQYATENNLLTHIGFNHGHEAYRTHFNLHVPRQGEFCCIDCGKKYSSDNGLRKHRLKDHATEEQHARILMRNGLYKLPSPIKRAHVEIAHEGASSSSHVDIRKAVLGGRPLQWSSGLPSAPVLPALNVASALPPSTVPAGMTGQGLASVASQKSVASLAPVPDEALAVSTQCVAAVLPIHNAPCVIRKKYGPSMASDLPVQSTAYVINNKHATDLSLQNAGQAIHSKKSNFDEKTFLANHKRNAFVAKTVTPAYGVNVRTTRNSHARQATCICTDVPGSCAMCKHNEHISTHRHNSVITHESAPKRIRSEDLSTVFPEPVSDLTQSSVVMQNQMGAHVPFGIEDEPSLAVMPLSLDASAFDNSPQLVNATSTVSHGGEWMTSQLENGNIDQSNDLALDFTTQSQSTLPDEDRVDLDALLREAGVM